MNPINRRDFIKRSAGAFAVTAAFHKGVAGAEPVSSAAAKRCALGKTGLMPTRLGVGTGTRAWNKNSAQIRKGRDVFLNTLTHAWEQGIRYYDLADMYGSHQYLRDAMAKVAAKREELVILTKLTAKTGKEIQADLTRSLEEINTEYLDVVLLHCMTSGDWPEEMAECMIALEDAQTKGLIKAKGVSCHNIDALRTAASLDWVDVILARINPFGTLMDGSPEEIAALLRGAREAGKGVIGMKILGEGKHADEKEKCIQYAMNLDCIDVFTIGFLESTELDEITGLMNACAGAI